MLPLHPNKWPTPAQGAALIAFLLVAGAVIDWLSEPYPMSDSHWDASIYLLRARSFANGGWMDMYLGNASELHAAVLRGVYPTPYWSFMRLGQTAFMGTIVGAIGTDERSIHVLTGLYRVLLAAGLFVSAMVPIALARVLRPGEIGSMVALGAAFSVLLYLLSPVSEYLSGNLVSEVPAIALIGVSAWSLVRSWERQSMTWAVVSGAAAFILYVVRMESIWVFASLLGAAGWVSIRFPAGLRSRWRTIAISGATALLLYLAYSWWVYPLTDPRLAVSFAEAAARRFAAKRAEIAPTARIARQLFAGNGLLWIGAAFGLLSLRGDRAAQFGAMWLLLSLVPVGLALGQGAGTETRMYTTLTPPLLLLSALGWASLAAKMRTGHAKLQAAGALAACVVLVLIAQPSTYTVLRSFPGMWRLKSVQEYLAPQPFERVDFHLPELNRIQRFLGDVTGPFTLVASPGMQRADHVMVIQYLYGAGETSENAAVQQTAIGRSLRPEVRVHLSREPSSDVRFVEELAREERALLVRTSSEVNWPAVFACCGVIRDIVATDHYLLSELERSR